MTEIFSHECLTLNRMNAEGIDDRDIDLANYTLYEDLDDETSDDGSDEDKGWLQVLAKPHGK